ncbi:LysR substrate-binding domain-containing protein [Comamonas thiooxydans]|uniref:LysR substrate-binding domain-containing protein n=1 Tax=Comamonas thiooxydans TaxID=363952 RepID=UPI002379B47A|nr:LysR substrate-binding domain-containing protein [Comamonas thiooxydans]
MQPPFMLHVLVPLIAGFRARYPEVELELNSNEGIIGVLKDSTLHARPVGISRIRVLASPAYLKRHGMPASPTQLAQHSLLGFTQPESLNDWPLRDADGNAVRIRPDIASSSGETLRHMALAGLGIVCLSDFMTRTDREQGNLVQLLGKQTLDICQPINAVYYRNTALAARITCFVDHVVETLGSRPFGT